MVQGLRGHGRSLDDDGSHRYKPRLRELSHSRNFRAFGLAGWNEMANHKSAEKRARQTERRTLVNQKRKSRMRRRSGRSW